MPSLRQLHLGAVPYGTGGPGSHTLWLDPDIPGDASVDIAWFSEMAQLAERGLFDLVFIVDSQFITPYSPPHYLNRLEPLTLLSALATQTAHIGLVGTATTSFNSPFNLVRRLGSLDLISGGRAGWNVVTTGDAGTAANYGHDEHYDTRYGRAQEYVELAVLAGIALTGSARVDSWEAEVEARSACPVHRRVIDEDTGFTRGGLNEDLPWMGDDLVEPSKPVLVLHGTDDPITSALDARAAYDGAQRATVWLVCGGRHDVLNDASHRSVAARIVLFLESLRLGSDLPAVVVEAGAGAA